MQSGDFRYHSTSLNTIAIFPSAMLGTGNKGIRVNKTNTAPILRCEKNKLSYRSQLVSDRPKAENEGNLNPRLVHSPFCLDYFRPPQYRPACPPQHTLVKPAPNSFPNKPSTSVCLHTLFPLLTSPPSLPVLPPGGSVLGPHVIVPGLA